MYGFNRPKKMAAKLEYVVLLLNKDGGCIASGTFVAASREDAIEQAKAEEKKHPMGAVDFKIDSAREVSKRRGPKTCQQCQTRINYGKYCGRCEFGR